MNLSPEEKEAGKRSFLAAMTAEQLDRRDFMKAGVAAGVVSAGSLGAFYFGYEAAVANPVRVGVLGTGDEGNVLIGAINPQFIEVKAIADIRPYSVYRAFHGDHYSPMAAKARPGLMAVYGWKTATEAKKHVKVYNHEKGGYQGLIDNARKDGIEAVIIALPLHEHARAAIAAMNAGLHVLTEKLMGHSVRECKEMARVADETGFYLATGHQRHYNILYHEAVDTIQRGVLGDLHYIRAQWHRGNLPGSDSWQQPMPEKIKPKDRLAKKLAGDLKSWEQKLQEVIRDGEAKEIFTWQKKVAQKKAQIEDEILGKTAKDYDYQAGEIKDATGKVVYQYPAGEEAIRWRLWNRTGGGLMAELGSHQLDAASIFISAVHGGEKQYPLNVSAMTNRPLFAADRDVNDHVCCIFEFPAPGYVAGDPIHGRKKIGVQYASINGNGYGGYGEIVYGTKGTLILEGEKEVMLFQEEAASKIKTSGSGGPALDTTATGEMQAAAVAATADVSRGYTEELEHWAWCIRNPAKENQPRCHPKVAMADAVIALTTNIAARQGRRVEFKKEWFDVDANETPENPKNDKNLWPDPARYKS